MKLTPKQEKFCQLYIELGNASEAYRQSYNCEKMKADTVKVKASQMLDKDNIRVTIDRLKESHRTRHNLTVDDLIDELNETRGIALSAGVPQCSAAVSATMSKAKLLGLEKQLVDVTTEGKSINNITISKDDFLEAREQVLDAY